MIAAVAALFRQEPVAGRSINTGFVLAIAAWLILNSHLEHFYPYKWLAADGLLGNSLFFWASGFGVQSSLQGRRQELPPYTARRLLRLYPAVLIVLAVCLIAGRYEKAPAELAGYFLWPTPFTYVQKIVPFYLLLWLTWRGGRWALPASLAAAAALYGFVYIDHLGDYPDGQGLTLGALPDLLWWAYFWMVTGLGALMARRSFESRASGPRLFGLLGVLGLYFALKFDLVVRGEHVAAFPLLHVAVLLAVAGAALTLCSPGLVRAVMRAPLVGPLVAISAALTLEIYLVHEPMAALRQIYGILFPLNIVVLVGLTLIGAIALHLTADGLRRLVEARPRQSAAERP